MFALEKSLKMCTKSSKAYFLRTCCFRVSGLIKELPQTESIQRETNQQTKPLPIKLRLSYLQILQHIQLKSINISFQLKSRSWDICLNGWGCLLCVGMEWGYFITSSHSTYWLDHYSGLFRWTGTTRARLGIISLTSGTLTNNKNLKNSHTTSI